MDFNDYFKGWSKVINKELLMKTLSEVNKLYSSKIVAPLYQNIFKAFTECPYEKLKVVILGQDPYPQKGVATGIAFGNTCAKLSSSLLVLEEACVDYTVYHPPFIFDYSLLSWANQGVLLLNSALTVEVNNPGSHIELWRPFIKDLLINLSNKESGIVYLLLGKEAYTFIPYINKQFNFILTEKHPSYYARVNKSMPNVFKTINNILKSYYDTEIEWYSEQKD